MNDWKNNQYFCTMLKDVVCSIKNGKPFNLQGVLEILNTLRDIDMQVKLLSILSAYLMLNEPNIEAIVTFNPLYDQACKILSNCPPKKTTIIFNFLSALLYVNEEDSQKRKSMIVYARNMMRSSGCLASLCELFSSCMMNQDAWQALCRCLAETCRGVEANQSYCTHLVPMCVQRCTQRNIEVLLVLQSLLQNHCRNISLFLECNGLALFQRDFLQLDVCLQLLATIAQSSPEAVALITRTDICQQLRDFLHLYGPQSKLGQWATIILHHTSKAEKCENPKTLPRVKANKPIDPLLGTIVSEKQNYNADCSTDTTRLFKNVIKEIYQSGAQNEIKKAQEIFSIKMNAGSQMNSRQLTRDPVNNTSRINNRPRARVVNTSSCLIDNTEVIKEDTLHYNQTNELSFSFLRKQNLTKQYVTTKFIRPDKNYEIESIQRTRDTFQNNLRNNSFYQSSTQINGSHTNTTDTIDFKPYFASTPKKESFEGSRQTTIHRYQKLRCQMKRRRENKTRLDRSSIVKEVKHRSISGRFFDAINESCTTLVKTVKNIFRPKINIDETKEHFVDNTYKREASTCNYSFTNYMRKRDAVFLNKCSKPEYVTVGPKLNDEFEDFSVAMSNSCNTCNNTISLKCKLANDEHLKKTIRKLKLGINLYGCDFKKISRAMWPQESYMTPAVLYNLYRKLIIK